MDFGELKRNFEVLKLLIEKQETKLRYCETKAQNVILAYLIWERFFFFAISQKKCVVDSWVILGLSLSSTFVYFLFFLEAVTMLSRAQYQMDVICKEQTEICQQILVARSQEGMGLEMEGGNSSDGFEFSFHMKMLEYDAFRIVGRKAYICLTVSALLAVTVVELYACKYLLCN